MHRSSKLALCVACCTCGSVLLSACGAAFANPPVLVLTDNLGSSNPFGRYWGEMLRGEGLMAFERADRALWNSASNPAEFVSRHSTVVLTEMELTSSEEDLLRDYVRNGGMLVSARPDADLSDLFGIQHVGTRAEQNLQYYGVDAATSVGRGITHESLQYHGQATTYSLNGATPLAYLYNNSGAPSANPAVTTNTYGAGKAVAFAFDPAKSVVLTRQGNPEWENTEGDNIPGFRPHDMFSRTNGATYYDVNKLHIPHADELQRFVANVVVENNPRPLPRLWYLPNKHKTIMVNTGDGEDNFGAQFNQILEDVESYGGLFSIYLRTIGILNTTAQQEAAWRAAGHEVGVHVYGDGPDGAGAENVLAQSYYQIVSRLQSKYGHVSRTARNHTIDWTGWVEMARIEAGYGTQLDTNYYHYPDPTYHNPLTSNGYFTGSGLSQRFIDAEGRILPIYQVATQWPDEWFANTGLSAQQSVDIIKGMFEAAEEHGYYSAFVNNIHPVRYYGADITSTWAQAIWAYCQDEGVPMWSAEMLLDFVRARDGSQFINQEWHEGEFQFDFLAGMAGFDLTLMVPVNWLDKQLASIEIDGNPIEWSLETIKGIEYAMFTTQAAQAHITAAYLFPLPGDFNGDGIVDAADYVVWRNQDGTSAGYELWRANFGATIADVSAHQRDLRHVNVPELGSVLLWLQAGTVIAITRLRTVA